MAEYTRPPVEPMEFRDASGEIVNYGDRWAHLDHSPPEDSYSRVRHPERFAPVHTVANALVDHLAANYDVDVVEGNHLTGEMTRAPAPEEVQRALQFTPRSDASAPLTFVFTDFPGLHVQAGALFTATFPTCGCDACDETWETTAEEMEWQVLAIVDGGLTERVSKPRRAKLRFKRGWGLVMGMGQTVSHSIQQPGRGRWSGHESRAADLPKPLLKEVFKRLSALAEVSPDGSWQSWPTARPPGSAQ